jgi:peptidoglycan hydrolase-like protein with peptidoglycan-binding domain
MSGDDVKELQSALIKLGFNCGRWGADGDFGDATQMAVQDFQKSYGLKPNGIFDRESYEMLMKADDSIDLLPVDPIYVEIVGGNCFIRTGPFKECDAIKVAFDGQRLPFAGLINEENGWLEVEYEPDKFGWVSPKYGRITG